MSPQEKLAELTTARQQVYELDFEVGQDPRSRPRMRLIGNQGVQALEICLSTCDELLDNDPSLIEARFERGLINFLLGHTTNSIEDFKTCLGHISKFSEFQILFALSSLAQEEQRVYCSQVLQALEKEHLCMDGPACHVSILIFYARTYLADGHFQFINQAQEVLRLRTSKLGRQRDPIWLSLLYPMLDACLAVGDTERYLQIKKAIASYSEGNHESNS